jgi:hypothetical protein
MSRHLYDTRVFWDGRKGGVSIAGVYRNLTAPPIFRGVEEIDYAPAVGCKQLRPQAGKMREMWGPEIEATEKYLQAVLYGGPVVSLKDLSPDGG